MAAVRLKPAMFLSRVIPAISKSTVDFYEQVSLFLIEILVDIFLFPMNKDIYFQSLGVYIAKK